MSKVIDADTLRSWLDEGRPVTVLDIRTDEDRAQWAIPGSVHVNAYEALRAGETGPLAGGMKAWSLAWNTAANVEVMSCGRTWDRWAGGWRCGGCSDSRSSF